LTPSPEALRTATADLLADRAARWRSMKQALARHGRNAGAVCAANYILERLKAPQAASSARSLVSP